MQAWVQLPGGLEGLACPMPIPTDASRRKATTLPRRSWRPSTSAPTRCGWSWRGRCRTARWRRCTRSATRCAPARGSSRPARSRARSPTACCPPCGATRALCRRYRARGARGGHQRGARGAEPGRDRPPGAREAGLELEVVSGREEARLICLGVLHGKPANARSLCIDIGGGSTELATARAASGRSTLWSAVAGRGAADRDLRRVAEGHSPSSCADARSTPQETVAEALPRRIPGAPRRRWAARGPSARWSSFAGGRGDRARHRAAADDGGRRAGRSWAPRGGASASTRGAPTSSSRARSSSRRWSHHLGLKSVTAVDAGLRDGCWST